MKLSELLTAKAFNEIAQQAEANTMAKFEDELWAKLLEKIPAIARSFPKITPDDFEHIVTLVHELTLAAYNAGAIVAASQTIVILLQTIKNTEAG